MARIRSVKPEYAHSEAIAVLPRDVRLHFVLLWTYADDYGRGKDEPRIIKGAIWPLDDDVTPEMVDGWQQTLAEAGRILRYTVDGRPFFQVTNWMEHQKPNRRTESKIPAPEQGISTHAVQAQCMSTAGAVSMQREFSAVDGGGDVEVEGGVATSISPQLPVVAEAPPLDVDQAVNRAVGILANMRALGGDNPGALAAHIGRTLPDHERAELAELIATGMEPGDAAAALADPLRGLQPKPGGAHDPSAVQAAAEAARRSEEATRDRLTLMGSGGRTKPPSTLRDALRASEATA